MEVSKDSGFRVLVPAHLWDACVERGDPIDGPADVDLIGQQAWHPRCSHLGRLVQALKTQLEARLGRTDSRSDDHDHPIH